MPIVNSIQAPMQVSHIPVRGPAAQAALQRTVEDLRTPLPEFFTAQWKPEYLELPRGKRTIGRYELLRADADWLTNPPESPLQALLRENQQVTELMTPGPGRSRFG